MSQLMQDKIIQSAIEGLEHLPADVHLTAINHGLSSLRNYLQKRSLLCIGNMLLHWLH